MAAGEFQHRSVMPAEVLEYLAPRTGEVYLDGTLGGAGHARLILEASSPDGILVGLDRDPEALAHGARVLASFGSRAILRQCNFSEADAVLAELGIEGLDGLLLDLGVSSHQLDASHRGFSFRADAPLDMRMNPEQGETAADLVNRLEGAELARIFRDYGEERWAGRIARRIVQVRTAAPLRTTTELAELVMDAVPKGRVPARIHPATRVFQALRIFLNRELEHLEAGLARGLELLKPGGRLVVISFHSLEDRIVKKMFQAEAQGCICPPRLPRCSCNHQPRVALLARKGVRAGDEEVAENPRARSAILRAIRRL